MVLLSIIRPFVEVLLSCFINFFTVLSWVGLVSTLDIARWCTDNCASGHIELVSKLINMMKVFFPWLSSLIFFWVVIVHGY